MKYVALMSNLALRFYIIFLVFFIMNYSERCWSEQVNNGTLKVTRLSRFTGYINVSSISIDGITLGNVKDGETKEFYLPIKQGKVTLSVTAFTPNIDFSLPKKGELIKEIPIDISLGDNIDFEFYYCSYWVNECNGINVTKLSVEHNQQYAQALLKQNNQAANEGENKPAVINLIIDKELKSKTIKESPAYNVPQGQEKIVEDTLKVVHTVNVEDKEISDIGLKTNIILFTSEIRKEVQKVTSKSDAEWTEIRRSVKIIGNGEPMKVVWSELYRTGIAKVEKDGKIVDIPFEYKEDFDLSLIPAK